MKFWNKIIEFFFGEEVKAPVQLELDLEPRISRASTHAIPNRWGPSMVKKSSSHRPCKDGSPRKPPCLIKINQNQATQIVRAKHAMDHWNFNNPKDRLTVHKLTEQLNARFNMNKSRTYYANVWNGHTEWDITQEA